MCYGCCAKLKPTPIVRSEALKSQKGAVRQPAICLHFRSMRPWWGINPDATALLQTLSVPGGRDPACGVAAIPIHAELS